MSSQAELLLRQAEAQMRRNFQPEDGREAKRQKTGEEYVEVGRFDYSAVGELDSGATGFLITCNFRNEKTATKEANKVLVTYLQRHLPGAASAPEAPQAPAPATEGSDDAAAGTESQPACKPLLSIVKLGCRGVVLLKLTAAAAELIAQQQQQQQQAAAVGAAEAEGGEGQGQQQQPSAGARGSLAAVQLVQRVATELLADVEGGKRKRLLHCQRIVPIATTCSMGAQQMQQAGRRLAELAVAAAAAAAAAVPAAGQEQAGEEANGGEQDGQPKQQQRQLSFGVAFKARCCNESGSRGSSAPKAQEAAAAQQAAQQPGAEAGASAAAGEGQGPAAAPAAAGGEGALGRTDIIKAVAAGFESVLRDGQGLEVRVDLKSPDWVVQVEELPVMGSAYLALAALPGGLCNIKNKMQMRQVGALSTRGKEG